MAFVYYIKIAIDPTFYLLEGTIDLPLSMGVLEA